MQKLQLKHLAPYLSYNLKVVKKLDYHSEEWANGEICTVFQIGKSLFSLEWYNRERGDIINIGVINSDQDNSVSNYEGDQFKPILRPLSDLITTINHQGAAFCPIIELARINDPNLPKNVSAETEKWSKVNSSFETAQHNANFEVDYDNGRCLFQFSYWEKSQRFLLRDMTNSLPKGVGRQLEMFNKLFEWKFDVFNLIDQNLAIDVNSLSENVY